MSTPKPIEYVVEFYHSSLSNDPEYTITSSTPIMGLSVGDYIHLGSWGLEPEKSHGKITLLRHDIYNIATDHITHQIGVVYDYVDDSEVYKESRQKG